MKSFIIGIDVGGTNIKIGLMNRSGKIFDRSHLVTRRFIRNKAQLIEALAVSVDGLIKKNHLTKNDIKGIGIGLPGLVNAKLGVVSALVNIPHWKNVPLKKLLEGRLRVRVFIDNDVNLMALGEWKMGAGQGAVNLVCITLGTGVGGGLIVNGALYRGSSFSAGEIGHIPLNEKGPRCNCGGFGCLERYIGNKFLLRKAKKIFKRKDVTLEMVKKMADHGHKTALQFWKDVGVKLGNGLASVVNVLNPDSIVIGGGVSDAFCHFSKPLQETLEKRAMKIPASVVKIKKAKLGFDAGILGAGILVKEALSLRS